MVCWCQLFSKVPPDECTERQLRGGPQNNVCQVPAIHSHRALYERGEEKQSSRLRLLCAAALEPSLLGRNRKACVQKGTLTAFTLAWTFSLSPWNTQVGTFNGPAWSRLSSSQKQSNVFLRRFQLEKTRKIP